MAGKTFIEKLKDRQFSDYLVEQRNGFVRNEQFDAWKQRIGEIDWLIAGNYSVLWPNQLKTNEKPMVSNIAQVMSRDVPRLVADTVPSVRSVQTDEGKDAAQEKYLREAVAMTLWDVNEGDLYVPQWTIDLLVTGGAFAVVWEDDENPYAQFERIDPRFCYPDIRNGKLQDLLVVQRVKTRQAARMFPNLNLTAKAFEDGEVEIVDYYAKDMIVKAVCEFKKAVSGEAGHAEIVQATERDLKRPPVAFAQLPTHDGAFRGIFDQVGDNMLARNRVARLMTAYVEQQIAAPIVEKGLLNKTAKPGPNTMYSLDPNVQDASVGRLQPAGSAPQLFALMQVLSDEARSAIGYPAAREGQVEQSIASASFVASTQGNLTGIVREAQRYIGHMREQLNASLFEHEEKYKNERKPLVVGGRTGRSSYLPSAAIKGIYKTTVVYGASAGLDRMTADNRLLNLYSAGIITQKTARENLEFVEDPKDEADTWEEEQTAKALLQKMLSDPNTPFDIILDVYTAMQEGLSFAEAVVIARKQAQERAAAATEAQMPQMPPGMEPQAQMGAETLDKGGRPAAPGEIPAGGEVQFNPPPLSQLIVRPQ